MVGGEHADAFRADAADFQLAVEMPAADSFLNLLEKLVINIEEG